MLRARAADLDSVPQKCTLDLMHRTHSMYVSDASTDGRQLHRRTHAHHSRATRKSQATAAVTHKWGQRRCARKRAVGSALDRPDVDCHCHRRERDRVDDACTRAISPRRKPACKLAEIKKQFHERTSVGANETALQERRNIAMLNDLICKLDFQKKKQKYENTLTDRRAVVVSSRAVHVRFQKTAMCLLVTNATPNSNKQTKFKHSKTNRQQTKKQIHTARTHTHTHTKQQITWIIFDCKCQLLRWYIRSR